MIDRSLPGAFRNFHKTPFPFFPKFFFFLPSFFNVDVLIRGMKGRTDFTGISDGIRRRVKLPRKKRRGSIDDSSGIFAVLFREKPAASTVQETIARSSCTDASASTLFLKVSLGNAYWKRDNDQARDTRVNLICEIEAANLRILSSRRIKGPRSMRRNLCA